MSSVSTGGAAHSLRRSSGIDDAVIERVRAVGARLGPRVPEMVERFYDWLSPLPEFATFFADDFALLAHVKSQQIAYWRDFLRAEVDDDYVERRRIVGQVHARIELGLLIYLRAMEFVADWLVRRVEEDDSLAGDGDEVVFALRKLVHFDSSIVVNTYATRTAQILDDQRARLRRVANVMQAVSAGDLDHQLATTGDGDLLERSVNDMVRSLRSITQEMRSIAQGDYSADVAPRSARDQLGVALQAMTRALREAAETNQRHLWITTSLTELAEATSGNPTLQTLSQRVVSYLCRVLKAQVGTMYVAEGDTNVLTLCGSYAIGEGAPPQVRFGEGLPGQAALEKRALLVSDLPPEGLRVRWGFGDAPPRNLAVEPLLHDDHVYGVIEVGSLSTFDDRQRELLTRAASTVALAVAAAQVRARAQQLLEESQAQAEELTTQQEELRSVNETLEAQARALAEQKENLVHTQAVLRDKATELEQASRYKSEFLANMSHELRTPLNSSLILAKLLAENRSGNLTHEQVRYAKSIHSSGTDLLTLINDILDLSKIEAGKVELNVESVDLATLLAQLAESYRPLAREKHLSIDVDVDPRCPRLLRTDPQRVSQVLTNLLGNAIKFTARGGIRLRAAPSQSGRVALSVQDTGIGIDAEKQALIFEAFRQADGSTSRVYGGSGLGLSICRELASLLGGSIYLESAPDQGSTFTLELPSTGAVGPQHGDPSPPPSRTDPVQDDARTEPRGRPAAQASGEGPTDPPAVLIVEDDLKQQHALVALLRSAGVDVVTASTAERALSLLDRRTFQCVVVDLGLPDESGTRIIERMAQADGSSLPPVIVHTARDLAPEEERQLRRLSTSIIIKGVHSSERLLEEVTLLLRQSPQSAPGQPAPAVAPPTGEDAGLAGRHVLLVEDDVRNVFALTSVLESRGLKLDIARNGKEAVQRIAEGLKPDLVLMDLMMPEMDGLTAMRLLREREGGFTTPIIALTAKAMPDDRDQCLAAGANDYLSKPVDTDKLLSLLRVWMSP